MNWKEFRNIIIEDKVLLKTWEEMANLYLLRMTGQFLADKAFINLLKECAMLRMFLITVSTR